MALPAGVSKDSIRAVYETLAGGLTWLVGGSLVSSTNPMPVMSASGVTASATFTPAAAAYGAADLMDVAKEMSFTYANGVAVPASSLIRILSAVTKIDITSVPSGQTSYTLQMYSVTPPSAQADNAAWTLASGDLSAYRGSLALGAPADLGGALYVKSSGLNADINLGPALTSIYAQLITDGAHTATAVARTVILYGIVL